ncbi:MAG: glycosyltransferase family 4 protein [Tatlockia sp.]|nr:glycosyltransferase family 4 protein [Tatlockia sp.]
MSWLFYLFIFSLSLSLTWALHRFRLSSMMLDVPNHRSSHVNPTPRGGGLAFVFCFSLALIFLWNYKLIGFLPAISLLGTSFFIAFIGFMDDLHGVSVEWRLLGHFIAASLALYGLGGMAEINLFYWTLPAGLLTSAMAVLYLVWLLNLYNFMDGIDGLAAIEAITVCIGGALLYYFLNQPMAAILPLTLAVSVAGFLIWNFPPARIFMGDAGSGFLGFVLGLLSIQAAIIETNFFWAWLILLGVFIVDATVTLLRRIIQGEVIFEAHRSHAYQHASRFYGRHRPVTLAVLVINLLWLFPMAFAVGFNFINGSLGMLIAYFPLFFLVLKFKAGLRE